MTDGGVTGERLDELHGRLSTLLALQHVLLALADPLASTNSQYLKSPTSCSKLAKTRCKPSAPPSLRIQSFLDWLPEVGMGCAF
jgi:hypothetical protein